MNRNSRTKTYLSKREKAGSIFFLVLLCFLICARYWRITSMQMDDLESINEKFNQQFEAFRKHQDSILQGSLSNKNKSSESFDLHLKEFDPNEVSLDNLIAMGLPWNFSKALVNYRNSGAKYNSKEDLLKIYGISNVLFDKLKTYVQIKNLPTQKKIDKKDQLLDINKVHFYELTNDCGLPKLMANRILNYRKLLGGYHSLGQLNEVYGMTDSLYYALAQQIQTCSKDSVKKIPINESDPNSISRHPYISKSLARAIVAYRQQHGNFDFVEQIKNVHRLTDSNYVKLAPYLTINDTIRRSKEMYPDDSRFSKKRDSI